MSIHPIKKVAVSLLIGFTTLNLTNCKKSEIDPPEQTAANCKLMEVDRGNGTNYQYAYNTTGYVSKWTIKFSESSVNHTIDYLFNYNSSNQITGAKITVDGKTPEAITDWSIGNAVECRWTNGKLSEIRDMVGEEVLFTTSITYDAQGRITRIFCMPADPGQTTFEKTYTYDANENIRYFYLEDGLKLDYDDITVDQSSQSAESLLAKRGMVFDFFNLIPWRTYNLKKFDTYHFDNSGKPVLAKSYQITNVVKNKHNLVTSQTVEEGSSKRIHSFTLMDCD